MEHDLKEPVCAREAPAQRLTHHKHNEELMLQLHHMSGLWAAAVQRNGDLLEEA